MSSRAAVLFASLAAAGCATSEPSSSVDAGVTAPFPSFVDRFAAKHCDWLKDCNKTSESRATCEQRLHGDLQGPLDCAASRAYFDEHRAEFDACLSGANPPCSGASDAKSFCPVLRGFDPMAEACGYARGPTGPSGPSETPGASKFVYQEGGGPTITVRPGDPDLRMLRARVASSGVLIEMMKTDDSGFSLAPFGAVPGSYDANGGAYIRFSQGGAQSSPAGDPRSSSVALVKVGKVGELVVGSFSMIMQSSTCKNCLPTRFIGSFSIVRSE
jgi:hypothetical protein